MAREQTPAYAPGDRTEWRESWVLGGRCKTALAMKQHVTSLFMSHRHSDCITVWLRESGRGVEAADEGRSAPRKSSIKVMT